MMKTSLEDLKCGHNLQGWVAVIRPGNMPCAFCICLSFSEHMISSNLFATEFSILVKSQ